MYSDDLQGLCADYRNACRIGDRNRRRSLAEQIRKVVRQTSESPRQ